MNTRLSKICYRSGIWAKKGDYDPNFVILPSPNNRGMKHFIEIDDSNKTGRNLLSLIKTLSGKESGIDFISDTVEDKELVGLMKTGIRSGLADRKSVLKKLGIE